jgi:hypothetical protein
MSHNLSTTADFAKHYASLGFALVAIPAGSKAPTSFGWQTKATAPEFWDANPSHNIGLLHSMSGTVALDIDHMLNTRTIFEGLGIDLDAILENAPRIVGRPDRGKALFAAPAGDPLTTRKISWPVDGDPRRTEVVFELRAGSVQDVLPPSIHPDTGQPYTWAGADIANGLPELPEQLLTIWRQWDKFRPQLADLCPWKRTPEFKPPSAKVRRVGNETQDVIGQYNDAVPMAQALTDAGYRQIGNRWLSPNSTSKIAGVVIFDDGRAYSHHASDPFDLEHSFDAFEVFCQYQHMGNAGAAVKAAAELLDIKSLPQGPSEADREAMQHGASVAANIMGKAKAESGGIPSHLLTVPGVLGEVVKYSAETCIKRQPQFDVQTALALGAVAMGRRFITDNNNMSGLFFLNIGKTGCGKEHANTVIEDVLEHSGKIELRGPNGYTSATGVLSALLSKPAHLAVIDEFGSMLQSAGAKGNQHKKDALTMMMEAFGRQTKTIRNLSYATINMTESQRKSMEVEIKRPSLSLIGMTTPETFYEALSGKDIASGFLNRFVIVESKRRRELSRKPSRIDPPSSVIAWVKACSEASGDAGNLQDNGAEFPPEPVLVPFTAGAERLFREYEQRINDRQDAMKLAVQADMLNRTREIAMRVSMIVAVSLGDKEISETAAQWAIDYVDYYATQTLEALTVNLSEGDTDSLRKQVANAIQEAGPAGLKVNELIKAVPKLGNLRKFERDGLLAMVCEDYSIERLTVKPEGGKGRPSIIHKWAD